MQDVVLNPNVLLLVNGLASAGVIWKGINWLKEEWKMPGKYAPIVSVVAGMLISIVVVHFVGGADWAVTLFYGFGLAGATSLSYDAHKGLTSE